MVFVGMRIYDLWREGPQELPKEKRAKVSAVVEEVKKGPETPQIVSTKSITEKNLFDPERGASKTKEAEVSAMALQRIRSMVLIGTAIFDTARYAILQESSTARPPGPRAQTASSPVVRLKQGDTFDGFTLSEIHERRVVFTKGVSKVEVAIDFSRKVEEPGQKAPLPVPPRPAPPSRIPRRQAGEALVPQPNP